MEVYAMASASKYGTKFTCFKCECKFYDLNRGVAICPRCGVNQAHVAPKEEEFPEEEIVEEDRVEVTEDEEEPEAAAEGIEEELPEMEEDLGYDETEQPEEE